MKYVLFVCNHNAGRSQMAHAFFERLAPGDVGACADAVLSLYDDVPIRSHVLTLAHRQTSECLAGDMCDASTAV